MKKQHLLLSVTLLLGCLLFTSCTAKLTTVRPSSISKLHVERIADGVTDNTEKIRVIHTSNEQKIVRTHDKFVCPLFRTSFAVHTYNKP